MAFPIASVAQGLLGLGQTLFSGKRKAEKRLERLQTPTYGGNAGITNYYNQALQRFNTNPFQTAQYQTSMNNAGRTTAFGLNALQGRGSAIGGISRLAALQNDASLRAGAIAEQNQNQRFNQLGSATGMKYQDDLKRYQQNVLAPYEKQYSLLAAKASGANKTAGAGIQNIFGGLAGIQQQQMLNQIYPDGGDGYDYTPQWSSDGRGFNKRGYATGVF